MMFIDATEATTVGTDPLLLALVAVGGVVVGTVLSGLFALMTGAVEHRREHARWLRAERLESYAEMLRVLEAGRQSLASVDGFKERAAEMASLQRPMTSQQVWKEDQLNAELKAAVTHAEETNARLDFLTGKARLISNASVLNNVVAVADTFKGSEEEYRKALGSYVKAARKSIKAGK